ncbi:porin [Ramlibacter sp. H39-3-26]|uniref:porin n=1 Tax=Curvibacter soli TaxID=3031331 RepID=UPI0023DAD9B1|nr:porin [Ramlibacter sp. H39-3-26]MDF1484472.1 porin [Ramlibacter sp. H39-3-26]
MQNSHRLLVAALAVIGSGAAFAQSSVTLYGRVNTSIEHRKIGGVTTNGEFNNASRFGFKGEEDLGGGLKAGFVLEAGFDSSSGSGGAAGGGINFGRQSEVNLSGGFGMLRLGTWTSEAYYAVADYGVLDQPNHDTGVFSDALYSYYGYQEGGDWAHLAGADTNKIAYRTPAFGGLTVEGTMGLHEKTGGSYGDNKNQYELAANWEGGNLALGAGYTKYQDYNDFGIRAHYTTGPFQIGAYYQNVKDDNYGLGKRDVYRVTGGYFFGASEVILSVGHSGEWDNVANSDATQYTVGYNYNLSKRTKVYGAYTKVNNKSGGTYASGVAGDDFSSFGVGIRHNF